MTKSATPSDVPNHFELEWKQARELIDKQDERIQETRKLVFGLFSSLLTASSLFGPREGRSGYLWVGAHLSLLGLLVVGRFVEQQALMLQGAAASRAFVLELLTPVELTGTLSDRYLTGWAQRTTYIYIALGLVSTVVAVIFAAGMPGAVVGILVQTVLYGGYIVWLGHREVAFARNGQDWSFSTTACGVGEPVSILLTNLKDEPLYPNDPAGELRRILDEGGRPVHEPVKALRLHPQALDPGRSLPHRRPHRWLWFPEKAGLWTLKVFGEPDGFTRRSIHVRGDARPSASSDCD